MSAEKQIVVLQCPVLVVTNDKKGNGTKPINYVVGMIDMKTKQEHVCCVIPDYTAELNKFNMMHDYVKQHLGSFRTNLTAFKQMLLNKKKKVATGYDLLVYNPNDLRVHMKTIKALEAEFNLEWGNKFGQDELKELKRLAPKEEEEEEEEEEVKVIAPIPSKKRPSKKTADAKKPVSEEEDSNSNSRGPFGIQEDDEEEKANTRYDLARANLKDAEKNLKRAREEHIGAFEHLGRFVKK